MNYKEAEEISDENTAQATPLNPWLGEEIVRAIFSKNWNFRLLALEEITKQLGNKGSGNKTLDFSEEGPLFIAVMGAVSQCINDKIAKVQEKAMNAILVAMKCLKAEAISGNPEFRQYTNEIIVGLMVKLGDSKTTVKQLSGTVIEELSKFKEVGCKAIVSQMCKQKGLPKVLQDYRHLAARVSFVKHLVKIHGANDSNLNLAETVDFAAVNLENTNPDVRKASIELIVEFMKVLGPESVSPMLEGVRKNIIN